jgi:cysteine desulfurase
VIYLDHNATTPVAAEVAQAILDALREAWGNPSSGHAAGLRAREAVEGAREQVAALLGAPPGSIVFTGGGTESNHLAVLGAAEALEAKGRHLVASAIEHPAITAPLARLERRGWTVSRIPPAPEGNVRADDVIAAFRDDTVLVTVMHANNETGAIQPVAAIARAARARGIVVHTDAAQSVGKVPTDVDELGVDLLTIAGHKLYAPKGVGALYVREGTPLTPQVEGGGQERGIRAGTEAVPSIAGLGVACALARSERRERRERTATTRDRLEQGLRARFPDLVVHAAGAERLPNTLSCAFPGHRAAAILAKLDDVACSAGAACHDGHDTPSAVLLAMGVPAEIANATLRLTTGRSTTEAEIDEAVERIATAVARSTGWKRWLNL